MKASKLLSGILIVLVFIVICPVSAESELVPNVPRTDEHIGIGPNNYYIAELDAGHWTVIVTSDSFWNLEIRIIVAFASNISDVIAVSGNETGNFPRVDFTLATNTTVDITVEENSVYHDTSGFYDIGVYDDQHLPGFLDSLDIFDFMIIFIVVMILFIVCTGVYAARRASRRMRDIRDTIRLQAPIHAIPEKYQGSVQYHGSQTTTVRLPLKCPSCGAEVSHESVDWVGPLEAKCSYCGATMRATFEPV
jgi:hypothetical protein